jgi:hypothetical protein
VRGDMPRRHGPDYSPLYPPARPRSGLIPGSRWVPWSWPELEVEPVAVRQRPLSSSLYQSRTS